MTFEISPVTPARVSAESGRLLVQFEADALDLLVPPLPQQPFLIPGPHEIPLGTFSGELWVTQLCRQSFEREGTPNEGLYLTQGIHATPAYDFENTQYLLSFGSEILESYWSPVQALAGYGKLRRGRPGQRGKLVYIGPRLSITGIKADEWIPISPGTEGMLALGIAHMIVKEGLQNKSFVSNHTFGFENWTDGSGKEYSWLQRGSSL